ncbi:polysaccharide deacetylase family protein [Nostoc sp. CMAA1605]|uniref:polysaccharide deacetylase family protein n=1 Tax=Nostoc sp. CMAA1605 TaxID=2055159 RepID=UPI001F200489|nr:polysaccharide deacetylase family protein [Nostoc sp. CMAA1605]MCF4966954.1 polysaccharide deacetylase [Nostoc sp. CMAA1605]
MTDSYEQTPLPTAKPQNFLFNLALVSVISLAVLNLNHNDPIVPVLGFHGLVDTKNTAVARNTNEMQYSQQEIEKLLDYLIINDYWFLSTQDLYDFFITKSQAIPDNRRQQKPIMISFDDGYKSVHTKLLPILSKLEKKYQKKIKVVLFINPGNLAKPGVNSKTHMGCQDLREGLKKGFYDIQSHGLKHKDLTTLSRRELLRELVQARTILRNCTQDLDPQQQVASHFAYPYGATNKQVASYVSRYYLTGYLYNNEILNHSCINNHYQIPRLMVNRHLSPQELIQMSKNQLPVNKQKEKSNVHNEC